MRPQLVDSPSDNSSSTKWNEFVDNLPKIDMNKTAMQALPPPAVSQHSSRRSRSLSSRIRSLWFDFTRRLREDIADPVSSSQNTGGDSDLIPEEVEEEWKDEGRAEKIVVEQSWAMSARGVAKILNTSDSSDPDPHEIKSGASPPIAVVVAQDKESAVVRHGFWTRSNILIKMRYRIFPNVVEFFFARPFESPAEEQYRHEEWQSKKKLAFIASLWWILSWILAIVFLQSPWTLVDKIFYYGIGPAATLPLPLMVVYDFPRRGSWLYQCFLSISVWTWAFGTIIVMYGCGFYNDKHKIFQCSSSRDFIGVLYFTTAYPTIALFALRMNRLTATLSASSFFIVSCVLIVPDRNTWIRSMVNFLIFQAILIYVHNIIEKNERRMFALRNQVKIQFRATQRAQINERKSAESKVRLTSYVFHEVRVPLNAALLAVQNIEASKTVSKEVSLEFDALTGSLNMMSQVLNDVLDFNKMDSGQFELVNRPFAFHQAMRTMLIPLRMATAARGLNLVTSLDSNIDTVARRAAYECMMGETIQEEVINKHLEKHPNVDGVVIGDEARFRQIVTNLSSNACKFTPEGGTVKISTKLILPSVGPDGSTAQHNINQAKEGQEGAQPAPILVRIEVTDTGCGIEQSQLKKGKLFSAFNQTEQGRQQGGKGTGLGLALVKNIVKLSGGRLGVSSEVNKGSTFWVELPLGVGRQALIPSGLHELDSDSDASGDGADLRKIRTAARQNGSPGPLSHDNLPMAVDAAALNASQLSSLTQPNVLTHSALMEQEGSIDLVVRRGSMSSVFPASTSPLPTPATEKSYTSARLVAFESPTQPTHDMDSLKVVQPPPQNDDLELTQTQPISRPNFIALPSPSFRLDKLGSPSNSVSSPMSRPDHNSVASSPEVEMGPLKVLVVDDDKITRMLMERMLQRLGCDVSTAENGEVALRTILGDQFSPSICKTKALEVRASADGIYLRHSPVSEDDIPPDPPGGQRLKFSLVFLDNQMPTLSGLKTVEILRRLGRKDFIVGLTGNALLPDQEEYLRAGVDAVLTKPVHESSIRNMLKQADVRRKRQSRTRTSS